MPLTVNCRDIGADCDFLMQGGTMDEMVTHAAAHAVDSHGMTEEVVGALEWREQMTAVIRNISRPPHLRASSPPVPPAPYDSAHSHS